MKRKPLKEYFHDQYQEERWVTVVKQCFDGKQRRFKPTGYDCMHYGYGIGGAVKCAAFPGEPKHGCPALYCPWRCKHFKLRKNCG